MSNVSSSATRSTSTSVAGPITNNVGKPNATGLVDGLRTTHYAKDSDAEASSPNLIDLA
jgi:hypothetical protein